MGGSHSPNWEVKHAESPHPNPIILLEALRVELGTGNVPQ